MQNKAQQPSSSLQQPRVVITADQRSFKIIFTAGMYPICFKAGMYLIFKPDGSAHDQGRTLRQPNFDKICISRGLRGLSIILLRYAKTLNNIMTFEFLRSQWKWKTLLERTCKRCLIMKKSHIYKWSLDTFISTIIKHLHVWFSVVRVRGSADWCQPGPGPAAGSDGGEGGGVVTRH